MWPLSPAGFETPIACLTAVDRHQTIWLQFVRFNSGTSWNFNSCGEVTFSAPYTRTSIAAQMLCILCSYNWCDSLANWSCTLAFPDFNIFCSWKAPLCWYNYPSTSSSTIRDRLEWFCSLTNTENSHNVYTAQITISSEPLSAIDFALSFIRKIYICYPEPLRVCGSCRTGISRWSNSEVDWTDIVAFVCTYDDWWKITCWLNWWSGPFGAPRGIGNQFGSVQEDQRQSDKRLKMQATRFGASFNAGWKSWKLNCSRCTSKS